jgi:hypothetical protein
MGSSLFWFLSIVLMPPAQNQCLFSQGVTPASGVGQIGHGLLDCNGGPQGLFAFFWIG